MSLKLNKKEEEDVNPWRLFKISEAILAFKISSKISETFTKIASLDLNVISDNDRNILLTLSDNSVPYEWRKMWQGPKVASEFLKAVISRIQNAISLVRNLNDEMNEIDFSKIFNVDSFLSTVKLVTARNLKVSSSNLILEYFIDEKLGNKSSKIIKVAPLMIDGFVLYENRLVAPEGYNSNNMSGNVFLYYRESSGNSEEDLRKMHVLPLYSNYSREKLLCTIKINSNLEKNEIIYSGTAFIVPQ